jgi:hypothetical protein
MQTYKIKPVTKKHFVSGPEKYLLHKLKDIYNIEVSLRVREGSYDKDYTYFSFLQEVINHYKQIIALIPDKKE